MLVSFTEYGMDEPRGGDGDNIGSGGDDESMLDVDVDASSSGDPFKSLD